MDPKTSRYLSDGTFADDDMSTLSTPSAQLEALARNWWIIGIRGGFAVLAGVLALLLPGPALGTLVLLFAAYLVVDGIVSIASGVRAATRHGQWGLLLLEGLVDLLLAAIAIWAPLATILAFVYLIAAWAVVSGVVLLLAGVKLSRATGSWWMGLAGAVSIAWGAALFTWPAAGALVLTIWLGAYALIFGVALLLLSFKLRKLQVR